MKSVLIIGMGRFGRRLAQKMNDLNNEVMVVDKDPAIIDELASHFADAQIGDSTNENFLKSLGVDAFDLCFVTIGENFQASLETTSLLKDYGAKFVLSKAQTDIQAKFLLKNGADEVVYPELEVAENLAIRYSANNMFDYIELTPEYSICEIPVPKAWIGKSIVGLHIRGKYNLNILATKKNGKLYPSPSPEYKFNSEREHMIVMGKSEDIFKLTDKQ